jgi:hypothetical protein
MAKHRNMQCARSSAVAITLVSVLLAGAASAQDTLPAYPAPLTSLPDAEVHGFQHWGIAPSVAVPTDALQRVINAQAGNANFVALSEVGPGLSEVGFGSRIERIEERSTGEIHGPSSFFSISTRVLNIERGTVEAVLLRACSSDPEDLDDLMGSAVSMKGKIETEIAQEEDKQVLKLKVKCKDGFRIALKARIPRTLGFRIRLDPVPLVLRFLTDGPSGSHPGHAWALESDVIALDPGSVEGIWPGMILSLPGGRVPIRSIVPGIVLRSFSDRLDVE